MTIGSKTLTLKQFMLRQQVIKLYRDFFRIIRSIPDKNQQKDLANWVRSDFKQAKSISPGDEEIIKARLFNGEKMLRELKQSVELSRA